jgi:hypothetical protein
MSYWGVLLRAHFFTHSVEITGTSRHDLHEFLQAAMTLGNLTAYPNNDAIIHGDSLYDPVNSDVTGVISKVQG